MTVVLIGLILCFPLKLVRFFFSLKKTAVGKGRKGEIQTRFNWGAQCTGWQVMLVGAVPLQAPSPATPKKEGRAGISSWGPHRQIDEDMALWTALSPFSEEPSQSLMA